MQRNKVRVDLIEFVWDERDQIRVSNDMGCGNKAWAGYGKASLHASVRKTLVEAHPVIAMSTWRYQNVRKTCKLRESDRAIDRWVPLSCQRDKVLSEQYLRIEVRRRREEVTNGKISRS